MGRVLDYDLLHTLAHIPVLVMVLIPVLIHASGLFSASCPASHSFLKQNGVVLRKLRIVLTPTKEGINTTSLAGGGLV